MIHSLVGEQLRFVGLRQTSSDAGLVRRSTHRCRGKQTGKKLINHNNDYKTTTVEMFD